MRYSFRKTRIVASVLAAAFFMGWVTRSAWAQSPPSYPPEQLDKLVSRVALYPDPLLAQVLAAATFPDQIPDAAKFGRRSPLFARRRVGQRHLSRSTAMGS